MQTRTPIRTEPVTTRLTPTERALVEAAAVAMGVPRSSAVRELILPAARRLLLSEPVTDDARSPA